MSVISIEASFEQSTTGFATDKGALLELPLLLLPPPHAATVAAAMHATKSVRSETAPERTRAIRSSHLSILMLISVSRFISGYLSFDMSHAFRIDGRRERVTSDVLSTWLFAVLLRGGAMDWKRRAWDVSFFELCRVRNLLCPRGAKRPG
jgi:hypothetical protein